MTIVPLKGREVYFDIASRIPTGERKENRGITWTESKSFLFSRKWLIPYSFYLSKRCSKSTMEYEAIITRIKLALQVHIANLIIYSNSELIVKQLRWEYNIRKVVLIPYHSGVEKLLTQFEEVKWPTSSESKTQGRRVGQAGSLPLQYEG